MQGLGLSPPRWLHDQWRGGFRNMKVQSVEREFHFQSIASAWYYRRRRPLTGHRRVGRFNALSADQWTDL